MSRFAERVAATIRQHALLAPGDRVVVAISGGPDSVALTHALLEIAPALEITVAGLAHLHHGLRGVDADADEQFCRDLAAGHHVPIVVEHVDVAAESRARKTSLERTAHDLRHAFLERARVESGATQIALGHTLDDQAETFLLRLLRGAGPRGLGAMRPRRGAIIRPLLDVSRAQVLRYLTRHGHAWHEDCSNRDPSIPRNRLRHAVMPVLEREFGASVRRVLARNAELARDDEIVLMHATEAAEGRVIEGKGPVTLHLPALGTVPPAVRRRLVWLAIERTAGGRFIGWRHVQAVLALAEDALVGRPGGRPPRPGASIHLPGVRATRRGGLLTLEPIADPPSRRPPNTRSSPSFRYELKVPGAVDVPEAGLRFAAELRPTEPGRGVPVSNPLEAVFDAERLHGPLTIRSRHPGDRVRPPGLNGTRKLQDELVDRRVPRQARDRVPLVTSQSGEIAWIVGLAVTEPFRATSSSSAVLFLKATPTRSDEAEVAPLGRQD
jgi:tRNA(Ile)-lysidine synthase